MSKRFWMVWNSNGRAPCHRHLTEAEAIKEAERLMNSCARGDDVFYVLEAKHRIKIADRPVEKVELANEPFTDEERRAIEHDQEIPF
jgi:hypothetical protein